MPASEATAIRAATDADLAALLELNNAHHTELGPLDDVALAHLLRVAFHVRVAGAMDGFLIALEQGADYASPNFRWFEERFDRFAYIDRVVTAARARKRGIARALYDDLFAAAREAGHTRVACEVNYDPPNPASDAFHARLGFEEIGRAHLPDRGKAVRYLVRTI